MNHSYVLGIDGGGTKTHLALAMGDGQIVAREKTGHSNLHNASRKEIATRLKLAWMELADKANVPAHMPLGACVAGLAGLDSEHDAAAAREVIKHAFGRSLTRAKVSIVNDTIIGFHAGSNTGVGVCVIGGTGSNGYGRNSRGREAWAGGLGHIMADEGSGYEIGLKVLRSAARAADGRGPKTKLLRGVLDHFHVKTMRELVPVVYSPSFGKYDLGQLAFVLQAAAAQKDKVAIDIAKASGVELALLATTVARKLFKPAEVFDLVMIGGVLQHDPIVGKTFMTRVRAQFKKAEFIIPKRDPVEGAVRMAMQLR